MSLSHTTLSHPAFWGALLIAAAIIGLCFYRSSRLRLRRRIHDLTAAQAQHRMILDQMPAIVWTVDQHLVFTSVAGAGMEALGATASGMVGKTIYQYFQTTDRSFKPIAAHEDAVRQGQPETYDVVWLEHTYHVRLEPWRDGSGAIVGAVGVALDITRRIDAEKALAASEARNRALLMAIPDVMFQMNKEGTILQFIDHLTAPADVVGSHLSRLFPQPVTQRFLGSAQTALQTGSVQAFDYETGTDHKSHYFEARLVSCGADEVLVIVRNITSRKREEIDLRQSQSELRSFLAALPDHILQVRRDGRIAGIFAARGKMHLPAEQVVGRHIGDFLAPEQVPDALARITRVFETGDEECTRASIQFNGQDYCYESRFLPHPSNPDQLIILVRELSTPGSEAN